MAKVASQATNAMAAVRAQLNLREKGAADKAANKANDDSVGPRAICHARLALFNIEGLLKKKEKSGVPRPHSWCMAIGWNDRDARTHSSPAIAAHRAWRRSFG